MEKPKSLKIASYLIYAMTIPMALKYLMFDFISNSIKHSILSGMDILLTVAFFVWIGYEIGRGKLWARTIHTLIVIYWLVALSIGLNETYEFSFAAILIIWMIQIMIGIAVVYILYTGDCKKWYKELKRLKLESKSNLS